MAIIEYMKNPNFKRARRGLAACVLLAGTPAVSADNVSWTAGDGAWESPANWSGSALPTAADFVDISHSGAVSSTATANAARELLNKSVLSISAGRLAVEGTIETSGLVSVSGVAVLDAGRITIASGGGLDIDTAGGAVNVVEGVFNSGNWQMTGNHSAAISAESFDNFNSFIIEGAAGTARATANSMINHNGASALVTGAGSTLVINGALTNDGNIEVANAGELHIKSIDNNATMVVDKGKVQIESQINLGSLEVTGEGGQYHADDVVTNHGSVEVAAGATAVIKTLDNHATVNVDGAQLSGQSFKNDGDGSLSLSNGATVSVEDAISASRFGISIDGVQATLQTVKFQQLTGTTFINGGTLGASGEFGVQFAGGELSGHGTIAGKLAMSVDGVLTAGDSLDATQRFDVTAGLDLLGGTFAVDLGGTLSADYDLLDVAGAATLGGILKVSLLDGFAPLLGDAFDIILADSISGAFGSILLPSLGDGLKFTTLNGGSFFRLQVAAVPLPAPALLLGGALGVLGLAARRRQRG